MKREGFLNKKAMNFQRRRQLGIITEMVKVKKESSLGKSSRFLIPC
jgi:hypothetical protein